MDSVAVSDAPPPTGKRVWNADTARAAVRKRWENHRAATQTPEPVQTQPTPDDTDNPELDKFTAQRLVTVRAQMAKLDRLIAAETDPQKLDRLASAAAKFGELERQYAGRPLPGSLRPNAPSKRSMFDAQERTPARRKAPDLAQEETESERADQE